MIKDISIHNLFLLFIIISTINTQTITQNFGNVVVLNNEIMKYDLSEYINGWNLSYTTTDPNLAITPKWNKMNTASLTPTLNITYTSVPVDNLGNIQYGYNAAFLDNQFNLYYTVLQNSSTPISLSTKNSFSFLQNASNTTCYDLVVIDNDTAIIDCMNGTLGNQNNYFYTVSFSQQIATGVTQTFIYYNTTGSNRYLRLYKSPRVSYLYKTTYTDSTDEPNNTVIEIFSLANPTNPLPLTVIDRTALNATTLAIHGFDVYMGNIYFVDTMNSTVFTLSNYQVDPDPTNFISYSISLTDPSLLSLRAISTAAFGLNTLNIIVSGLNNLYEIDWTISQAPTLIDKYAFSINNTWVSQPDATTNFIYIKSGNSTGTYLNIFKKGQYNPNYNYFIMNITSNPTSTQIISRSSEMLYNIIPGVSIDNIQISLPYLVFSGLTTALGNYSSIINGGTIQLNITYNVINSNDENIYFTGFNNITSLTLTYPGSTQANIGDIVTGPLPTFTVTNGTVETSENLAEGELSISTFTLVLPDSEEEESYIVFAQDSENLLSTYLITLDNILLQDYHQLDGPIYKIALGYNFYVVITQNSLLTIQAWVWGQSNMVNNYTFQGTEGCSDLKAMVSGTTTTIFCASAALQQILIWNNFLENANSPVAITQSTLENISTFSPLQIQLSSIYPNLIFANSGSSTYIINYALLSQTGQASVVSYITLNDAEGSQYNRILVQDNTLIYLCGLSNSTQEWDISNLAQPYLRKTMTYGTYGIPTFNLNGQFNYEYTFVASSQTNNYYFIGYDITGDAVIQVAKSSVCGNNLYQQIPFAYLADSGININITSNLSISILSSTSDYDIISMSFSGGYSMLKVFTNPILLPQPIIINYTLASETSSAMITITSGLDTSSSSAIKKNIELNIINTVFPLQVIAPTPNSTNGYYTNLQSYVNTSPVNISIDLSDFFNGTIEDIEITLPNDQDNSVITLIPSISNSANLLNLPIQFYDTYYQNTKYGYVQSANMLFRLNDSNIVDQIDISFAEVDYNQETCTRIVVHNSELYSVSFCYDPVTNAQWIVLISYISSNPTIFATYQTILQNIDYAEMLNDYLFVLENNPNSWSSSNSRIHMFNITLGQFTQQPILYLGFVDGLDFNSTELLCGGFDVFQTTNGYRIFLADANYGIRTFDYIPSTQQIVNITGNYLINDPAFVNYNIINSIWLGVANVTTLGDNYYQLIVLTQNLNSYIISWRPPVNNTSNAILKVLKVFLNYADFTYLNIFDYNTDSSYLVVVGQNFADDSTHVIIYNANYNIDEVEFTTPLGIIPYDVGNNEVYGLQVFVQGNNSYMWVPYWNSSSSQGSIIQYQLSQNVTFFIQSNNLQSEYVNLTVTNYISSQTIQFLLNENNNPNAPSTHNYLWILFLGIGLVIGITVLIIAIRKCKIGSNHEEPMITVNQNQR